VQKEKMKNEDENCRSGDGGVMSKGIMDFFWV